MFSTPNNSGLVLLRVSVNATQGFAPTAGLPTVQVEFAVLAVNFPACAVICSELRAAIAVESSTPAET